MKVTVHNRKYNDTISFEVDELNEDIKKDILMQIHSRNWNDEDCWSEVDK